MNIEEFRIKRHCTENIKTIKNWLEKGYIRGAKKNPKTLEWEIPNEAKPPYTKCGKVKGAGIYKSIAKGVSQGRDVFAELYGCSEKEFNIYIKQMIDNQYLEAYENDGITYYASTLNTRKLSKMSKNNINTILMTVIEETLKTVITKKII